MGFQKGTREMRFTTTTTRRSEMSYSDFKETVEILPHYPNSQVVGYTLGRLELHQQLKHFIRAFLESPGVLRINKRYQFEICDGSFDQYDYFVIVTDMPLIPFGENRSEFTTHRYNCYYERGVDIIQLDNGHHNYFVQFHERKYNDGQRECIESIHSLMRDTHVMAHFVTFSSAKYTRDIFPASEINEIMINRDMNSLSSRFMMEKQRAILEVRENYVPPVHGSHNFNNIDCMQSPSTSGFQNIVPNPQPNIEMDENRMEEPARPSLKRANTSSFGQMSADYNNYGQYFNNKRMRRDDDMDDEPMQ